MSVPFDQIPSLAWDTADWFWGKPGPVPSIGDVQAAVACTLIYQGVISYVIDLESPRTRDTGVFAIKRSKSWMFLTSHARAAYAWREESRTAGSRTSEEKPPAPRLTVDLPSKTLTLDGISYPVPSERALRWVKILAERSTAWISSKDLKHLDPDLLAERTDRFKKSLPSQVLELIDSRPGAGSRIRLGAT